MTKKGYPKIGSLDALSSMLSLTSRRVHQLTKEGIIIRVERGQYDLKKSLHGYLNYLDGLIATANIDTATRAAQIEAATHRANYIREKTKLTRLQRIEKESLLVDKDKERQAAIVLTRYLRRLVMEIPRRLSAKIAAESDSNTIYRDLHKELTEALTKVADFAASGAQERKFTISGGEDCQHWCDR